MVGRLLIESRPVDRSPIKPGRRTGLQPRHRQSRLAQLGGKPCGRTLTHTPADEGLLSPEENAAKEGPGAQDRGLASDSRSVREFDASDPLAVQHQRRRFTLNHIERLFRRDLRTHRCPEQFAVRLYARSPYGASLGPVEHAVMDRARIRRAAKHTVERVDFAHQMALAQSADGRVAAHRADLARVHRDQAHAHAHARGNAGRFHAGVTTADDEIGRAHV